ncbi:MAG: pyruvate, water dikinase [Proteobacteria bacterium]|nr:pyruvate, water dikinase [Pseudomonadota bacterium]
MIFSKWSSWFPFLKAKIRKPKKDVETLRAEFRAHYHSFKLLLTANNKTLELMSEMEEALKGDRLLGMSFVHSQCTRVAANVFQIVKNLNEIAPGKYEILIERFKKIQGEIDLFLAHPEPVRELPMVLSLSQIDISHKDQVGGKMANVGELGNRLGVRIPMGFVITTQAYWAFMDHNHLQPEIREILQSTGPEEMDRLHELSQGIQQFIMRCALPKDLEEAIYEQLRVLEEAGEGTSLVMRSSALGEDLYGMSFAGQYLTEFNVTRDNIAHVYKKVVASKYSVEAITYRRNRGIRDDAVAMCVGCMPVVDCIAGGVAYSRNPLDADDRRIFIHSVLGLPGPVADGTVASDLFIVSKDRPFRIIREEIKEKGERFIYLSNEGLCTREKNGEEGKSASLNHRQILELARLSRSIEEHYGSGQDIEWGLRRNGTFVFLQSRRLKLKKARPVDFAQPAAGYKTDSVILGGGVCASPGAAAGPVFVVRTESDIAHFPDKAVLIAAQALPYWALLLNKAEAVVTEQGTAAGHLANVAREINVPALFGVDGVTERLETGQWITVDADARVIHEGKIEALVKTPEKKNNRLQGTPVHKALEGATKKIVPLNLIDPDSPKFNPRKCKTLHDITRFCHEKAVKEMFQFGITHRFPERSSRQLICDDVPMQFWLIDLDDGFAANAEVSRYIRLDEITSIPMVALWRGMMAIKWKGPPPVDARGFLGVLMESASNPALNPSIPSTYSNRNYFMISRDFLSLQSRFGYHFSTIEALVGERSQENYLSFQFNGGAASLDRRIRRTRLVLEVLEEHGFRTRLKQDNVNARIEGYEQSFMEAHLEILGYLVFHTRQLDMVMTDESSIRRYKKKITDDLVKLSNMR